MINYHEDNLVNFFFEKFLISATQKIKFTKINNKNKIK